jgi:hypothetical protein
MTRFSNLRFECGRTVGIKAFEHTSVRSSSGLEAKLGIRGIPRLPSSSCSPARADPIAGGSARQRTEIRMIGSVGMAPLPAPRPLPRVDAAARRAPRVISEAKPSSDLTEEERREIADLRRRDAEVRAHEQAHRAAAGAHVRGGPNYTYTTGPDGRRYATGGEVQLDASPIPNDAAATIRKMQAVRRAALAPADPSAQDRRVAAQANLEISRARAELAREKARAYRDVDEEQRTWKIDRMA